MENQNDTKVCASVSEAERFNWRNFKMMTFILRIDNDQGPKTVEQWFWCLWNYDIFIQDKVPFMKLLVGVNAAMWLLMWLTR